MPMERPRSKSIPFHSIPSGQEGSRAPAARPKSAKGRQRTRLQTSSPVQWFPNLLPRNNLAENPITPGRPAPRGTDGQKYQARQLPPDVYVPALEDWQCQQRRNSSLEKEQPWEHSHNPQTPSTPIQSPSVLMTRIPSSLNKYSVLPSIGHRDTETPPAGHPES